MTDYNQWPEENVGSKEFEEVQKKQSAVVL